MIRIPGTLRNLLLIICLLFYTSSTAQLNVDSLKKASISTSNDSLRYIAVRTLYNYYEELNRDSALHYAQQELILAEKNNKKIIEVLALGNISYQLAGQGKYAASLDHLLRAFKIAEDPRNESDENWAIYNRDFEGSKRLLMLSYTHHMFAVLMRHTQNAEQEIFHFHKAREIALKINYVPRVLLASMNLGRAYLGINKLDSALAFEQESINLALKENYKKYLGNSYTILGDIYLAKKDKQRAQESYYEAIRVSTGENNQVGLAGIYYTLSKFLLGEGKSDSALSYAKKSIDLFQHVGSTTSATVNLGGLYQNLYMCYDALNQFDSAYKYQGLAMVTMDTLNKRRIKNLAEFQNLSFMNQLEMQKMEKEKVVYQNKVRTWFLLSGIGVLFLLSLLFYRNNRQKHKAKIKIEKAYENLKITQQQLIQSEKMASLGELTAGIAHEIHNPLNFVNNFSEVNTELVDELETEISSGNKEDALKITHNIRDNQEKILHHGKRADAIVKSMLQHSRKTSGKKEPVDLNELADEYFRLAYHGLRAKDHSITVKLETDYDPSVGKITVDVQEIGRVLLNLLNNAFYASNEKRNLLGNKFEPTVSIKTKRQGNIAEVLVSDNGNGISAGNLEKIFQPFFTTKPTGQGTGLGLSLSYDIIKAHGGEIQVESKAGEGTVFKIVLPLNS